MQTFKSGEVVRLKSGSPSMTVNKVHGRDVECSWFVDGRVFSGSFDAEALKIDDEKGSKK